MIDATEGWFESAGDDAEVDQSDIQAAIQEQSAAADAVLLGRVTFEQMRGYWPQQTDDTTGAREAMSWCTNVMLPVLTMSLPRSDFNASISLLSAPRETVVCSHSGSCSVLETTLLRHGIEVVGSGPFRSGIVLLRYRTT